VGIRHDRHRLGPADEVNLYLDRGDSVYVVTVAGTLGIGGFVGSSDRIDIEALRTGLAPRIAGIPRLSSRIDGPPGRRRFAPTRVDLRQHIRLVRPVSGFEDFESLCARVATVRLPRERPLWELLIAPGDGRGVPAYWVFRVHHALADGATVARMLDGVFDPLVEGDPGGPVAAPAARRGGPAPARGRRSYVLELVRAMAHRVPRTVLLGRIGPGRRVRMLSVPLSGLRARANATGATINDVVLAVAGAGARAAYLSAGEDVPAELPVSVPVLLPGDGKVNQVSAAVVRVPLRDADLTMQLRTLAAVGPGVIARVRSAPLPWFSRTQAGARAMRWFTRHQRMLGLLTTNVRGPSQVRALCGAPVEGAWALPVLGGNVRVGVAATSYAGRMSVCVHWSDELGQVGQAFADGTREALTGLA